MPSSVAHRPLASTVDFLAALGGFLQDRLDLPESCRRIEALHRQRARGFLDLLRGAITASPAGPYARLLAHAGVGYPDVEALVARDGLDGALARLHDAGVYLTLDEFKGRRPIRRGSLELPADARAFDNRVLAPHFEVRTGGSRGAGRALLVDLELLAHEAAYEMGAASEFDLIGRRRALWRPVPPGSAGIKALLKYAKVGLPTERWFSQSAVWSRSEWRHTLFTTGTIATARLQGQHLPWPEHVPADRADVVAGWLAAAPGPRALLNTNAASAVRVCQAAEAGGLDIGGAFFRLGGEPYTPGKAAVLEKAGVRAVSNYSMSEVGRIATACARPRALDDVHVALDKVAVLARDVTPAGATEPLPGLFITTLHASTPKVMINVEAGDYGRLEHRACGCLWERLGLTLHLQDIRSYEKLTAEGMHFVGADLLTLVEETLPAAFGGRAMDYQLVEEERDGVPHVSLVVSPGIGRIDEQRVVDVVLERLGAQGAASRMMARRWKDAGTLQVVRREPFATAAGKVLALHTKREGR